MTRMAMMMLIQEAGTGQNYIKARVHVLLASYCTFHHHEESKKKKNRVEKNKEIREI